MHPSLTPINLTTPITLVSAALWCAAAVFAITVPHHKTNAPLTTAALATPAPDETIAAFAYDEEQVSTPKADRLPLFADAPPVDKNWQNSVPVAQPPKLPSPESLPPEMREPSPRSVKPVKEADDDRDDRHARHARHVRDEGRDVCQRHGMHKEYYHRGRWPSWRCRR
jgi:hypothetical protein